MRAGVNFPEVCNWALQTAISVPRVTSDKDSLFWFQTAQSYWTSMVDQYAYVYYLEDTCLVECQSDL